jgi:C2 domain
METDNSDDSMNAPNIRRPLTGKLMIRISAVKDVDHATTSRFSRPPETSVVIKVDDNPKQKTKFTRSDRWNEEYEIPVDKANEVEFTVYDKVGDQSMPIGLFWVRISDVVDALRRRRIEQEVAGSGWVSADAAQAGSGVQGGFRGAAGRNSPSEQDFGFRQGGQAVPTSLSDDGGVEAWFALEPAGQILLTLNFSMPHNSPHHNSTFFRFLTPYSQGEPRQTSPRRRARPPRRDPPT